MSAFIAGLERDALKTAWQTYIIKHGFETIQVLVPLERTAQFEEHLPSSLSSKQAVLSFVREHGGEPI